MIYQTLQFAGQDERAPDVIEPDDCPYSCNCFSGFILQLLITAFTESFFQCRDFSLAGAYAALHV